MRRSPLQLGIDYSHAREELARICESIVHPRVRRACFWHDIVISAACAAVLSGIPSTLHAWWTGRDVMEATRAAGAMLIAAESSDIALFFAAVIVHGAISLFWAAVLAWMLPRKHIVIEALLASIGIAVLDLRIIGLLFPDVYALPFWPQFADHLAWGGAFGTALDWRVKRRRRGSMSNAQSE